MAEQPTPAAETAATTAAPASPRQSEPATVPPKPNYEVVTIKDLQSLVAEITATKKVRFVTNPTPKRDRVNAGLIDMLPPILEPGQRVIELTLRPLTEDEMFAADRITAGVKPPKKSNPSPNDPDPYDYADEKYVTEWGNARKHREIFLIERGVEGIQFEGNNLAEKRAAAEKLLSRRVLNFLVDQVEAISSNDIRAIDLASFS